MIGESNHLAGANFIRAALRARTCDMLASRRNIAS
jgi:hypothetical protein